MDNHDIALSDTNPRQTVYIFGCRNSTIQARAAGRLALVTAVRHALS